MTSNFVPSITFPTHIETLLNDLHKQSEVQEQVLRDQLESSETNTDINPWQAYANDPESATKAMDHLKSDKFLAMSRDTCHFMYGLARAINARRIVEVGTGFGISTIYLALAVGDNVRVGTSDKSPSEERAVVIATEKDTEKCRCAREYWKQAGVEHVAKWIHLTEGDLIQKLAEKEKLDRVLGNDLIDMVILDAWPHIAVKALQILQPRLRPGSIILTDGSTTLESMHAELFEVLRHRAGPFKTVKLPYKRGVDMSVYCP